MAEYLVRRSRTCCFLLGMVARASTMVQAACLAAWVAGVNSTWDRGRKSQVRLMGTDELVTAHKKAQHWGCWGSCWQHFLFSQRLVL